MYLRQKNTKQLQQHAEALRRVLDRDLQGLDVGSNCQPHLVALSGLPGTGKSHFARDLQSRAPLLVIESDRLRKVLFKQPKYTPGEHLRVFAACHLLIEEYLSQGRRVIFDATNLSDDFRMPLYHIAGRVPAPITLVRCTAPRDRVYRRLADRGSSHSPVGYSDAGWQVYCRLEPHEQPIKARHLLVDSSGDTSSMLESVLLLVTNGA